MKHLLILLTCLFVLCGTLEAQHGQRSVTVVGATGSGSTDNSARSVTFIFRGNCTVGGIAFTSSDVPLTIQAQSQDTIRAIPYSVSTNTLVIVTQK